MEVSDERLRLVAQGPISLDVDYDVRPTACGSRIHASISVLGQGPSIAELDLNPVIASSSCIVPVDARIIVSDHHGQEP